MQPQIAIAYPEILVHVVCFCQTIVTCQIFTSFSALCKVCTRVAAHSDSAAPLAELDDVALDVLRFARDDGGCCKFCV